MRFKCQTNKGMFLSFYRPTAGTCIIRDFDFSILRETGVCSRHIPLRSDVLDGLPMRLSLCVLEFLPVTNTSPVSGV